MPRRRKRELRPDEEVLWEKVKGSANPMHKRPSAKPVLQSSRSKQPPPEDVRPSFTIKPFRLGENSASTTILVKETTPPPNIDKKTITMMRRGKLRPEARIDLHGMTQDRAISALSNFIQQASARNRRMVLVITGKGRPRPDFGPIPERPGVLRRNVPQWLRNGVMGPLVQDVVQAHQSHGGEGAYYVYLRRRR